MSFKQGDVKQIKVKVTDDTVRKFAEVSGDMNPIHLDEEYAKTTRFGRRIAHGMISAAFISRAMGVELGPGGVYLSQELKFVNPVYIDDELTVTLTVAKLNERRGIGTVETLVHNQRDEIVVKGEALIMTKEALAR